MLDTSSQSYWNMNHSNLDKNLDIEKIAEYIAKTSQAIVNEMKNQDENYSGFEDAVQKMKDESLLQRQKHQEDFNARRNQLKQKINRKG